MNKLNSTSQAINSPGKHQNSKPTKNKSAISRGLSRAKKAIKDGLSGKIFRRIKRAKHKDKLLVMVNKIDSELQAKTEADKSLIQRKHNVALGLAPSYVNPKTALATPPKKPPRVKN